MTIRSQDVSLREKNKQELKNNQKKTMDLNLIEKTNKHYQSVQAATNDKKMVNLLNEVRKSDTTVNSDYARFNGTAIYNPPIKKKLHALEKETIDKIEKDYPTQLHGKEPKKRKLKKTEPTILNSSKTMKEEITWNYICEQLEKPRWKPSTTTLFGGLRNTSPTYLKETLSEQ
mgnify:FL=1